MVMDKNRRILVIVVIFIAFNALAFVIPFQRNAAFWTAYVFTVVAMAGVVFADWLAFRHADSLRKVFMGFPIAKIAYACLSAQLVISAGFMVAASFLSIPAWRVAEPSILVLAFGAVAIFKADWGRDVIEQIEEKHLANTQFMTAFRADTAALLSRITDVSLKAKVETLAKTAKRSDPVSSDALMTIEHEIGCKFEVLKYAVTHQVKDDVDTLADELLHLLNERNVKCRQHKQEASQ